MTTTRLAHAPVVYQPHGEAAMLSALRYFLARRLQGVVATAVAPVRVSRLAAPSFAAAAAAASWALVQAAGDTSTADNELQQRRLTKREALLEWSSGVSADRVNRSDPEEVRATSASR